MVFLVGGVLGLAIFFFNRWYLARTRITTRAAATLPLARRLNEGIAFCSVALIVLGLLWPLITST